MKNVKDGMKVQAPSIPHSEGAGSSVAHRLRYRQEPVFIGQTGSLPEWRSMLNTNGWPGVPSGSRVCKRRADFLKVAVDEYLMLTSLEQNVPIGVKDDGSRIYQHDTYARNVEVVL